MQRKRTSVIRTLAIRLVNPPRLGPAAIAAAVLFGIFTPSGVWAASDFETRCQAASVVRCFSFDFQAITIPFGQGQEFYVQWRQRFTPEFINTLYSGTLR